MPWLALPEQCRLLAGGRATTVAEPGVLDLQPTPSGESLLGIWWAEVAAARPRRGCLVRDLAEAEAAIAAGADFLIVAQADALAMLDASAIPVFVIAASSTTLASLRARGAHGCALANAP
jgi:hypothetical protein